MTLARKPLAISVGDPAGIGLEVIVGALARGATEHAVVFGDQARVTHALEAAGVAPSGSGLSVVHVATVVDDVVRCRRATAEGGRFQLAVLDAAVASVQAGDCSAVVTAPVSKEAVVAAGRAFRGQTEHLAAAVGLPEDAVTMMFLGRRLRVGLATTHVAVRNVPRALTAAAVTRTTRHLGEALVALRAADAPPARVVIAGLNPHASERGLFGDEEALVIAPGVARAAEAAPYANGRAIIVGVVPSETAFRWAANGEVDGVVAMMHDQATIASKLLDWGDAVNVTWGLPFVRTSVDHGVAYDIAGRGTADPGGMVAALALADTLARGRA